MENMWFFPSNYKIVTIVHSKIISYNCLRMCVVKNKLHFPNYKIVTASNFKAVSHNRLRMYVVK